MWCSQIFWDWTPLYIELSFSSDVSQEVLYHIPHHLCSVHFRMQYIHRGSMQFVIIIFLYLSIGVFLFFIIFISCFFSSFSVVILETMKIILKIQIINNIKFGVILWRNNTLNLQMVFELDFSFIKKGHCSFKSFNFLVKNSKDYTKSSKSLAEKTWQKMTADNSREFSVI